MDPTTITVALTSAAAIAGGATACIAAIRGLRAAITPITKRAELRPVVFHRREREGEAVSFVASLRAAGYGQACRIVTGETEAAEAAGLVGAGAVVLWRPRQEDIDAIVLRLLPAVAPEAMVLIYTTERLTLPLGERVLACNSPLRLRGDLAALAET